ncbi:hypothetical protein MNV49_005597 [Pseudohyphozyma bogoriensis]|nr:hypothetical protein MNV49_005597 [Pseudohyphozyma bogoriensis]
MPAPQRYFDKQAASTDAAEAAAAAKKEEISEGWKDKTTTQTTLHLTHLPSTLTSPQLSIIFSSYAPLRSAFVVSSTSGKDDTPKAPKGISGANLVSTGAGRDRTGKATSRGFGYVRFVLRTDADKCLEEWGGPEGIPRSALKDLEGAEGTEGIEWDKVCGKNGIKMDWAKKKLKEGEEPEGGAKKKKEKKERKDVGEEGEEGERKPHSRYVPYDHNASRTVIVMGIPLPLTEDEKAAKKAEKDEKMKVDGEEEDEKEEDDEEEKEEGGDEEEHVDEETGKPIDWKKALRQKAKKTSGEVEDLQWPVKLPSGESVATIVLSTPRLAHDLMKKMHNHVFRGVVVSASIKSSWDLVQRQGRAKAGGRLVVRNLGFDVTIADLRTVFSRFGALHSINMPLDDSNKPRGFAFIYYITKPFAEAALKAINGSRIYAGMAKERIESEGGKGGKKKEVREKKKAELKEAGGGGGERGRVVAVDWALGKDEWKKAQAAEESGSEAEGPEGPSDEEEDSEEEESDEEESDEEENDDSDLEPIAISDLKDEDEPHPDDDDDELEEEPKAPVPKGTTLFVRNIVFEATEAEVYDLFKAFGPVRYARIVYDPTTKRSRGTAFVCFWNEADAQKVLHASESLNAGVFGETSNKHNKQSLLMVDPGTSGASALTLHGRVLAAVAAVSKDDADKLREDRDKKGDAKSDRRNLYLMREGVIFPSWAIAQTLHPSDIAARQSSFDARKALLRSNPSLYISRTRLSVRQIPLYVSDGMMKRLANYAMKEFDKEVKAGIQKALTADEKNESVVDASGAPVKAERIRGVPPSRVRQAKILRQSDRVDPLTGLGRSKGYGFLELGSHADALRVLRWANANRDVGALFRGWWRETLENLIAKEESGEGSKALGKGVSVKDREERVKKLKEKMEELVEEEELAKGKAARREAKGKPSGEGGRSSKCLIIEFSIENQVTTKRRAEKAERAREKAKRSKDREASDDEDEDSDAEMDDEEEAPKSKNQKRKADSQEAAAKKKVKLANAKKAEAIAKENAAGGNEDKSKLWTGAIIGKKRRQQKAGKK